jgi:hypothetical protein
LRGRHVAKPEDDEACCCQAYHEAAQSHEYP